MKIIMLGAPGSGKGTQSKLLTTQLGLPQISTGDILRDNIKRLTPLGQKVKEIVARGELVSDDIIIDLVAIRLQESDCANGYILDGFPRSLPQAHSFDAVAEVDAVLNLVIDQEVIVTRMSGRRTCKDCGAIYHVSTLKGERCPACDGELMLRADDNEQTVRNRLVAYEKNTKPLISYYQQKGKLYNVDSSRTPQEINTQILKILKK